VDFFAFLVVDGALAGAIYALVALAFVVVYKASRMINFAVGEWTMVGRGSRPPQATRSGSGSAGAGPGMRGHGRPGGGLQAVVRRPLISRSLLSMIMVTIGAGIFNAGAAAVVFAGSRHGSRRLSP